jgi:DNA invertase Pin-like site-specific DNA recombinase
MTPAFLYLRFSPRPDAAESESLDVQKSRCLAYCEFNKLSVVQTFADPEVSARKTLLDKREGGAAMMAALYDGAVKTVVTMKIDRIFRNSLDGLTVMNDFRERGIALHFADQGGLTLCTNTAIGEFIFTVLLGMAAFEPAMTAERTSRALQHKQNNGKLVSRHPAFGWAIDPSDETKTTVNVAEQNVIEVVKRLFTAGKTHKEIATIMNERGIPYRGSGWCTKFVRKILNREMVKT